MLGLLNTQRGGLLSAPRQIPVPGQAPQGAGWMMAGGAMPGGQPAYGSDEWAMQSGGPGVGIWREMMRAMANSKNPLAFLDASKAGKMFSPLSRQYLAPEYQKKGGK